MPEFLLAACANMQRLHDKKKKMQGIKNYRKKGQIAQGSPCLSCTGTCKVAEILRLSLDGEEMSISSISLIFHVELSPQFATRVPPAPRPIRTQRAVGSVMEGESFHPSQTLKSSARQSHHRGETFLGESPLVSRVGRGRRRER